jgi:hypothetical protein
VVGLAEHRADAAHLEHQPLQGLVLAAVASRQEAAGLAGEVDQDGAGFHHLDGLAVGAVGVDDGRDLAVRVDGDEGRRELLALRDIHLVHPVGQLAFLQHDGNLAAVGRAPCVQFDHRLSSVVPPFSFMPC